MAAIARPVRKGDLPATAAALSAMLSSHAAPAPNDVTLLTVPSAAAPLLLPPLALSLHALAASSSQTPPPASRGSTSPASPPHPPAVRLHARQSVVTYYQSGDRI
ncbi:hypothetical protein ZWY2020_022742 [Hordeum vulgare]|nr:hypothetical protein ZWY2020_022742 [Hordeum vulgare]